MVQYQGMVNHVGIHMSASQVCLASILTPLGRSVRRRNHLGVHQTFGLEAGVAMGTGTGCA